ncbi:hypothetical protein U1Q18_042490 [Sarracenia purpurea var. burkii]
MKAATSVPSFLITVMLIVQLRGDLSPLYPQAISDLKEAIAKGLGFQAEDFKISGLDFKDALICCKNRRNNSPACVPTVRCPEISPAAAVYRPEKRGGQMEVSESPKMEALGLRGDVSVVGEASAGSAQPPELFAHQQALLYFSL